MKHRKHTRLAIIVSAILIIAIGGTAIALGSGRADTNINQLSLDDVRTLASKGDTLQYADLPNLRPSMLSSTMGGYNPTLYGVEGGYRLLINFNDTMNPESGISSTALESIWESGGSGIDIRYNDVDEFIRTHPSHPADTDELAAAHFAGEFVAQLKKVSLISPPEIVRQEIRDNYTEYVMPELLQYWLDDPEKAPGRIASSPWPERFEVQYVVKLSTDDEQYQVGGSIIWVTSVEMVNGGAAETQAAAMTVIRTEQGLKISEADFGSVLSTMSQDAQALLSGTDSFYSVFPQT